MKKHMPLLIVLFVILLMTVTNPSKQSHDAWLKEKYIEQTNGDMGKGLTALLGDTIIDSSTSSKDFMIISYYKTELDGNEMKTKGE